MRSKFWWWKAVALAASLSSAAWSGTFGRVVTIGGHASDLALDEGRGVLYIANFTANRIEVMSLADNSIQTSINVAAQPGSLALSPDGRYLVVAHFGNFQAPNAPANALTVIDLTDNSKQTFAMGDTPLGVTFGIDNRALVVTTAQFLLFDPVLGTSTVLDTVSGVSARPLPQPAGKFPAQIIASSVAASADGLRVYGLVAAGASDNLTMEFSYDVNTKRVSALNILASPPLGPRVISVSRDGSSYLAGWSLNDARGTVMAQFPNASGLLNIGSHYIDANRGVVYAQFSEGAPAQGGGSGSSGGSAAPAAIPIFEILDGDNLAVREKLLLPENLSGKSVMSADGMNLYSVSDSGVVVLPVGSINQWRRVAAMQEDLVFRGGFCDRRVGNQELTIVDPGGNNVAFSVSTTTPGVAITPSSGVTPATVMVTVDPTVFQNQRGTVSGTIQIQSAQAVNVPPPVRLLVNLHEPDQRGTFVNIPGKLVDLLPDPVRDRFYVLRQDRNQVLVYDGASYNQIATLKTGNTPTQMAITFDRRYLLVGHDNSQIITVYDLETLQPSQPVRMPLGHYPRSVAASGKAILVANRVAGPKHVIDRVDMATHTANELPTLGIYENSIHINTMLAAAPNGSSILAVEADGNVMLYNANIDTFTVSRKDSTALSGAYAASSYDRYVAGSNLLNASLVPMKRFESSTGNPSGFAFVDQFGFRTTAVSASSAGVIQRVDLTTGEGIRATRMVEAPVLNDTSVIFTRTLAPLYSRNAIINLTTSGFTVLSWNYDAAVASPRIDRVVNAADLTQPVAPGGLISVYGRDLSAVNMASREMPLPTALGESCLTVNGVSVPMLWVSPAQINAQLPFQVDGNVTMILRTPGGISDNFNLTVLPAAPSIFRSGVAGDQTNLPAVIRNTNNLLVTPSNPVHRGDTLVIFLTGMGKTAPAVDDGVAAPSDPLASVLIPPTVDLGGALLPVSFAGLTPGQVGVYQINVQVPGWAPTGMSVPLTISQSGGGATALSVRVVE